MTPATASSAARSSPRPSTRSAIAGARPRVASTVTLRRSSRRTPPPAPPARRACRRAAKTWRGPDRAHGSPAEREPVDRDLAVRIVRAQGVERHRRVGEYVVVDSRCRRLGAGAGAPTSAGRSSRSSAVERRLTVHVDSGPASRISTVPLTSLDPKVTSMSCRATSLSSRVILSATAVFLPATSPCTDTGYGYARIGAAWRTAPSLPVRDDGGAVDRAA